MTTQALLQVEFEEIAAFWNDDLDLNSKTAKEIRRLIVTVRELRRALEPFALLVREGIDLLPNEDAIYMADGIPTSAWRRAREVLK